MSDKEMDQATLPEAGVPGDLAPAETALAGPAPLPLPGELLAARRLELRLSVDDVSARVKLAPRQIIALETNDFAALPGMATARGFIRAYAKLLGLDPAPLLASITAESGPAEVTDVVRRPLPSPAFSGRRYAPPVSHRRGARRLYGLAAVVLVFVGTLAFIAFRDGGLAMPATEPVAAAAATAETPVTEAAESADVQAPQAVVAAESADQSSAAAPAPGQNPLTLVLREDAWVEVTTIDGGRKLVSKLMKAGEREQIEISEPVSLVVGNAAGVDASLRGQSLNLRAAARDNVAKLSLK